MDEGGNFVCSLAKGVGQEFVLIFKGQRVPNLGRLLKGCERVWGSWKASETTDVGSCGSAFCSKLVSSFVSWNTRMGRDMADSNAKEGGRRFPIQLELLYKEMLSGRLRTALEKPEDILRICVNGM